MKTPAITLFHESRSDIEIQITASTNETGDLLIEGYDSGPLVKELKGDLDYEYKFTVKKIQKELLIEKLSKQLMHQLDDKGLLNWLQKNYNHNEAFSAIQFLLDRMDIRYESFHWE
jgi:hypothetical protein